MRKQEDIVITDEGRDKDKVFMITEMSAFDAEEWAIRAILALTNANADIGDIDPGMGMAAFAGKAFRALFSMHFQDAKPLLDEMMACIRIKPDPRNPNISRGLMEEDIEEVTTVFKLRMEVFRVHTGFSIPGSLSN